MTKAGSQLDTQQLFLLCRVLNDGVKKSYSGKPRRQTVGAEETGAE